MIILRRSAVFLISSWLFVFGASACDDDRGGGGYGTEADEIGVGAQCSDNVDCFEEQTCLPFKGGYCGLRDCAGDVDCPNGSACVAHDDGSNYCFRICVDKSDCNINRDIDLEANCSSNVEFVDGKSNDKACVPPSG